MKLGKLLGSIFLLLLVFNTYGQENEVSYLSGSLETNGNFFFRDSAIGAANTPGYDRQLFGADAWLSLNYSRWGFDVGVRFDMFTNSNLPNPTGSTTTQGIGRWFVKKKINKLGIQAGYIYDQIGSGIIFRAFEARALNIDNSLYGLQLTYDLLPDWQLKVFTGRQKEPIDDGKPVGTTYQSNIRGLSFEGFLPLGGEESTASISPGIGVVGRTLDDNSMNSLVATINTYTKEDAFEPTWNSYAFSFYNTLSAGKFIWYLEAAYKSRDNMNSLTNQFFKDDGSVIYSSLSYANKGLGITLEGKRTENFDYRSRPQELLNRGLINFLPPMTRVNTFRLTARYNAATQFLGEQAIQADIRYSPKRKISYNVNLSHIENLEGELLYQEIYTEFYFKYKRKWTLTTGVQRQVYNQDVFEQKPGVPNVETITPYIDFLYRIDKKKSIRFEAQYMNTGKENGVRHDYGNWVFGLVEFSIVPHWTITLSDMYNSGPGKNSPDEDGDGAKDKTHFPRIDLFYTFKSNRVSLSYVKQVEGVVCTGGICRLEPAFSGVRLTVNSTF